MTVDPVTRHLSQELRNLARLAAQWADVLDAEQSSPAPEAAPSRSPPVVFTCARCGKRKEWHLNSNPWPGARCSFCYAEERMRRDEIQDVVVGYTGVR